MPDRMGVFDRVSKVGQGSWELELGDRKSNVRALRRGIELGLTHIDTAEMYGSGRVEEVVGEAIKGLRDQVFVVSKVLPKNASYERTIKACEGSLKRLQIEQLDVYLLHYRESTPLEETFRAFEKLLDDGKIAAWGVSNFDVADLEDAVKIVGPGKIACNQVMYNLWIRTIEHRLLPWCAEHGIALVAYSPLNQGHPEELGRTIEASAALRFLIDKGAWTIPKAATLSHVEENARALKRELSAAETKRLESTYPRGKPGRLPML